MIDLAYCSFIIVVSILYLVHVHNNRLVRGVLPLQNENPKSILIFYKSYQMYLFNCTILVVILSRLPVLYFVSILYLVDEDIYI